MLKTPLILLKSYKSFQQYCIFRLNPECGKNQLNLFSISKIQLFGKLSIFIYAKKQRLDTTNRRYKVLRLNHYFLKKLTISLKVSSSVSEKLLGAGAAGISN